MKKLIFSNEKYSVIQFNLGPLKTNCYVLKDKNNNAVIIDPGYCDDDLKDWIKINNITPKIILLTHGHFDHILGLKMFPDVLCYIHEKDLELLSDNKKNAANMLNLSVEYNKNNIVSFSDNFKIPCDFVGLKLIHTPGHTQGSTTYLAFDKILFTGDSIFAGTVGRCDLFGGSQTQTKETVKKIRSLKSNYLIYPGHGILSTLDREKRSNPHFLEN